MSEVTIRDRLEDILDAIGAIERYSIHGRSRFDADELVRVWCVRHIEIIGEATAALPKSLRDAYRDVAWRDMVAMRNLLIHGYRKVEDAEVWSVVERDLPPLRVAIERILAALPPE